MQTRRLHRRRRHQRMTTQGAHPTHYHVLVDQRARSPLQHHVPHGGLSQTWTARCRHADPVKGVQRVGLDTKARGDQWRWMPLHWLAHGLMRHHLQ